jgi:uncharacterized phage-associated protein
MTKNKKVSALLVAKYFIKKANESKKTLTNKKLQKLLYYAQVWSLVLNDNKLFSERIEAWIHGPAIPSVYREFKIFEFKPIELNTNELFFNFSKKQKDLIDTIWDIYGKYDAEYLEALTHSELPWQEARKGISPTESSSNIISLTKAKYFYERKLRNAKKDK